MSNNSLMVDNKLLDELVNFINTHIHEFDKLRSHIKNISTPDELYDYKQQILYISYVSDKLKYGLNLLDTIQNENAILYDNKIIQMCNSSIIPSPIEIKKINPIPVTKQRKIKLYQNEIIDINVVKKPLEIPNTNLYFINDSKEFGIKINNKLITGNLMNVLSKKEQYNVNKCNNVNCNNNSCKYYHSYEENKNFKDMKYYEYNVLDYKYRDLYFSSKHTIMQDIPKLTNGYKEYRKYKLMHEILMFQIISNYM